MYVVITVYGVDTELVRVWDCGEGHSRSDSLELIRDQTLEEARRGKGWEKERKRRREGKGKGGKRTGEKVNTL